MPEQNRELPRLPFGKRFLSKRGKEFVGLDIGSHSVKLMHLRRNRSDKLWKVLGIFMTQLPPDAIVEGRIMNFTTVIETIRAMVQDADCQGAECAIAYSGSSLILKRLSLPEMTRSELDESLMWEAEQYIPFDIKDVNVDADIMVPRAGQGQMDILMAALKKDVANEYVSVAVEAGLKPVVVEAEIISLLNLLKANYGGAVTGATVAMVNVGANKINVGVLSHGIVAFTRDIGMGSSTFTAEIQKYFNVSWEEAERLKKDAKDPDKLNEPYARDISQIGERIADMMVTEIQRGLDFFVATSIKADIARIYLTGGGGLDDNLINALERRMEVLVEVFNPFKNVEVDEAALKGQGLIWGTSVSLALRGLDMNPDLFGINLIGTKKNSSTTFYKPSLRDQLAKLVRKWFERPYYYQPPNKVHEKKLRVSQKNLLKLCDLLNLFMSAGVPVLDAMQLMAPGFRKPIANAIMQARGRVAEGKTLSDAFKEQGFPDIFCIVVQAGEIGGNLDVVLERYRYIMQNYK